MINVTEYFRELCFIFSCLSFFLRWMLLLLDFNARILMVMIKKRRRRIPKGIFSGIQRIFEKLKKNELDMHKGHSMERGREQNLRRCEQVGELFVRSRGAEN